jgi:hypothetical protein
MRNNAIHDSIFLNKPSNWPFNWEFSCA